MQDKPLKDFFSSVHFHEKKLALLAALRVHDLTDLIRQLQAEQLNPKTFWTLQKVLAWKGTQDQKTLAEKISRCLGVEAPLPTLYSNPGIRHRGYGCTAPDGWGVS